MKSKTIKYLSIFHRLTVFVAICYLGWYAWACEIETPEISTILEAIVPPIFDGLNGGSPLDPSDFVKQLKYKLWQI